ncbi:bifunctional hydroxymethylpyrimidine kinase/phosphomethylpyrimidine kinase [Candidatus Contendibacter odensensis]|uniref:hydroxymethylpyrimidine kinase n=1 Tax=Candidatus Contendobacter odensis Run_B_J11 TaxID=1400861 RepID=A0A7U7G9R0_9GAMM|nr:bifunctional hydroxymethylpyrimidine kinase/phosphomethylpyrimidine kinase [Candidatus Contendobacter odensis]MBK8752798.1 bifunctional hydroxymethylpyrimidine kinase/phosphomethylpyrimidine kinase [Candidatus Competibacteraceae bacterium]CDH44359.1 Phosphomethylpyrimidine kinase [Candidatus Contendobacter odensis Run_B_J11]
MNGRVLIIAGSDSSGGAGIQADLKTVTALGGYAATAITALTAQNTQGVLSIVGVDPMFITQQMRVVLDDIGADCIKTGMLHNAAVIAAVVEALDTLATGIPVVVDPVMYAKSGDSLLNPAACDTLIQRLLPRAAVITPNIREAEALSGLSIRNPDDLAAAAHQLLTLGPAAVLVKGGHLPGDSVSDWLVWREGAEAFTAPRFASRNTHGTGCTLASAIATGLAQGLPLNAAVRRALTYVREAIRTAPNLGQGCGPLNHGHTVQPWN